MRKIMDSKCPYCKRGTLKHVGNNYYECTVCIRGSFYLKPAHMWGDRVTQWIYEEIKKDD